MCVSSTNLSNSNKLSLFISVAITYAPASEKALAVALPIPCPAAVNKAVFPSKLIITFILTLLLQFARAQTLGLLSLEFQI